MTKTPKNTKPYRARIEEELEENRGKKAVSAVELEERLRKRASNNRLKINPGIKRLIADALKALIKEGIVAKVNEGNITCYFLAENGDDEEQRPRKKPRIVADEAECDTAGMGPLQLASTSNPGAVPGATSNVRLYSPPAGAADDPPSPAVIPSAADSSDPQLASPAKNDGPNDLSRAESAEAEVRRLRQQVQEGAVREESWSSQAMSATQAHQDLQREHLALQQANHDQALTVNRLRTERDGALATAERRRSERDEAQQYSLRVRKEREEAKQVAAEREKELDIQRRRTFHVLAEKQQLTATVKQLEARLASTASGPSPATSERQVQTEEDSAELAANEDPVIDDRAPPNAHIHNLVPVSPEYVAEMLGKPRGAREHKRQDVFCAQCLHPVPQTFSIVADHIVDVHNKERAALESTDFMRAAPT